MRRWIVAAFVVLGVLFAACAARAAEAVAEGEAPGASWTALIVSALAALGILDRLGRWVVRYWKQLRAAIRVLREVFAVIETLAQAADSGIAEDAVAAKVAEAIKAALRVRDATRDAEERAIVTKAAAAAEAVAGRAGSASAAVAEPELSKGQRFLNGAGKVLGFLVGFLPLVGRGVR